MKKPLIVIIVIILLLAGVVVGISLFRKHRSNITVADLQKKEARYEDLVKVSYFSGGGMEGSVYREEIYLEDGQLLAQIDKSLYMGEPLIVRKYKITDNNALEQLKAYVREYNLSVWDTLPRSEIEVLDAPGVSWTLTFNDEGNMSWVSINDDLVFPEGGYEVLNGLMKLIGGYIRSGEQVEAYMCDFYDEDYRIYVGRDIDNTDEEIEKLTYDYWSNGEYRIEIDEEGLRTGFGSDDDNEPYLLEETVHEPYKDYDCGWYQIYVQKDRHLYIMVEDFNLKVEDDEGKTLIMER